MLILGSKSISRRRLLSYLQIPFQVKPSRFDETSLKLSDPIKLARALAFNKALSIYQNNSKDIILTADTLVYYQNNIFGKPKSQADAKKMLKHLSGFTHQVITAYCLLGERLNELKLDQTESIKPGQFHELDSTRLPDRLRLNAPLPYLLGHSISQVTMRKLSETEIELYLSLEDATRFAGSYAIIDSLSIVFAQKITGSLSGIIGLPLETLAPLLTQLYPQQP